MILHCPRRLKIAEISKENILKYAQTIDEGLTSLEPLKIEASGRKYFRASSKQSSYVISFDDAEVNGQIVFINRANELADCNVRVPKIFQYDIDRNLTILEDLGDHSLIVEKNFYQQEKLVRSSLELLNQMHQVKHVDLHSTFWMGLESHSNKFSKVFCKEFLGLDMFENYKDLYVDMRPQIMDQQWTNCHFDFERRNLMVDSSNEIAVIDFQDLCIGPVGIDLAGIIVDHYISYSDQLIDNALKHYVQCLQLDVSVKDVNEWLRWGGIQRNMRILGTLSNLYIQDNRTFRLKDLPGILENLITLIPNDEFMSLKEHLSSAVMPKLHEELEAL